jgi:EAL domain-containing protein (putative c-di-GMP-specific phosphodiesterase class I)/GGDEF domain-containing protein
MEAAATVSAALSASPAPASADILPRATEMPGQAQLEAHLLNLIQSDDGQRSSLALLQLANFYEIRTWVGKSEANQLLEDIARVLLAALPASVSLYRCLNYEFALLLKEECSSNAAAIIGRLQSALTQTVSDTLPSQLTLRCVAGLVDISGSLRNADIALARARQNLRPRPAKAHAQPDDCHAREIISALRTNRIKHCYQPLLGFDPQQAPLLEMRSQLESGSMVMNGQQLSHTAVRYALGEALDRNTIRRALQLLRLKALRHHRLLVNLSLNSLVSSSFQPWLQQTLSRAGQQGARLIVQISEDDLLIAQHHLAEFDRCLQSLSVALSISHFGIGSEPLRYLSLLAVQLVKLAPELTRNLQMDSVRLQALKELTEQLGQRNVQTAACLVENFSALPQLWRSGLDWVQGDCLQASGPDLRCLQLQALNLT